MDAVSRVREATADDAEAILELALLVDLAEVGEPDTSIDEIRSEIGTTNNLSAVIEDPAGGGLLGHSWVEYVSGHVKIWGDITLRPGADPALAPVLLDWLRTTAQRLGPGLPVYTFANSENTVKRRLYAAVGGTVVRRFYRMSITFGAASPAEVPPLADGVEIRAIVAGDEADLRTMHAIVDAAFMDHFGHEPEPYDFWLGRAPAGDGADLSLWWLAFVDREPAAGLYASLLSESVGYVDTLGTLRAHRGKGLGRALLLTSFAELRRRGLGKVVLGVDATNPTGALALYESAGMSAEHIEMHYELPSLG
ncbi:MAG TPA: GNAT family N-acetyltransferase [Mycobacteriales bacterium]|jgi:ribosomal protein S18 acetylase RimI-like enzyme|nr:GNAT family N-acetyltransferase [Mycobacteriales bacterium]